MARKFTDLAALEALVWLGLATVAIGTVLSVPGRLDVGGPHRPLISWAAESVRVPLANRCDVRPLTLAVTRNPGDAGFCEAEIRVGRNPSWNAPVREPFYTLDRLATPMLVLAILVMLLRIVRSVRDQDPFTRANARRLTIMGLLVAIGGPILQFVHTAAQMRGLDHIEKLAPGLTSVRSFKFDFLPIGAGMLLIGLAEVFRQGARLREDVEGLV